MPSIISRVGAVNIKQNSRVLKLWRTAVILILGLALVFLISGCGNNESTPTQEGAPAKDGDTVRVHYTGKLDDGTEFDSSAGKDPLEFTIGSGRLIPGFNDAVIGMKIGESKTVTIPVDDAYGPYSNERVIEVDRSELPASIEPEVGLVLQTTNGSTATIIAVSDTTVTVDFNHPLAGKDLIFEIELVEIL